MEHVVYLQNADIYQDAQQVLQSVNLSLSRAEFVYLVGKTGSGKSSLLKTLWGEVPLRSGTGLIAGVALRDLNQAGIRDLRRKLGIVFQEFHLFEDWSVYDNLAYVLESTGWKREEERRARIAQVLSDVGLGDAGDRVVLRLSGGEQQRLVIARAMLNTPEIILADEPTGNLDPETSVEILHLLRTLAIQYSTAILMATHDYRIIERFPGRVYRCGDGQVVEED